MTRALLKGSKYSEPESLIANFYVLILTVFRNLGKKCGNYSWKSIYFLQFVTYVECYFCVGNGSYQWYSTSSVIQISVCRMYSKKKGTFIHNHFSNGGNFVWSY